MSRWYNRLAARVCERLHDVAVPAWEGEARSAAGMAEDDEWEDPVQEAMGRAFDEGAQHGYEEATREHGDWR